MLRLVIQEDLSRFYDALIDVLFSANTAKTNLVVRVSTRTALRSTIASLSRTFPSSRVCSLLSAAVP